MSRTGRVLPSSVVVSVTKFCSEEALANGAEFSEEYLEFSKLFSKRLWHQLSEALLLFVIRDDVFKDSDDNVIRLYRHLVQHCAPFLNQITLAQVITRVSTQFSDLMAALRFLEKELKNLRVRHKITAKSEDSKSDDDATADVSMSDSALVTVSPLGSPKKGAPLKSSTASMSSTTGGGESKSKSKSEEKSGGSVVVDAEMQYFEMMDKLSIEEATGCLIVELETAHIHVIGKLPQQCRAILERVGVLISPSSVTGSANSGGLLFLAQKRKAMRAATAPRSFADSSLMIQFYRVCVQYFKVIGDADNYLASAMLYLAYLNTGKPLVAAHTSEPGKAASAKMASATASSSSFSRPSSVVIKQHIPLRERRIFASDIALAALLSRKCYDFGPLINHPILDELDSASAEAIAHSDAHEDDSQLLSHMTHSSPVSRRSATVASGSGALYGHGPALRQKSAAHSDASAMKAKTKELAAPQSLGWLKQVVYAFNNGDLKQWKQLSVRYGESVFKKHPSLCFELGFLEQKIRLMTLTDFMFQLKAIELATATTSSSEEAFGRPLGGLRSQKKTEAVGSVVPFAKISRRCDVESDEVELLVMRAFALDLIRGHIDEIEGVVHVSYVAPRTATMELVNRVLLPKLQTWCCRAELIAKEFDQRASAMLPS